MQQPQQNITTSTSSNNNINNPLTLQQQQEQLQQLQIKRKEEFNEAITTLGVQSITELTTSTFCTNTIKIKILKLLLDIINNPLLYSKTVIRYAIKGIGVIGCQDESLVTQTITFLAKILEFKSENYHYMKKVCFHALSRIGRKYPVYQSILLVLFEKYIMSPLSTNDTICSILVAYARLSQTNSQIRAMSMKRWLEATESPIPQLKSSGILSLGYASCPTGNIINDKNIESICYSKSIELLQFHKVEEVLEDDPWKLENVYQVQVSACKALGLLARSSTSEWLPKISKIFKTILSSHRYAAPVKATVLLNYGQISYYLNSGSPFFTPLKVLLFELSADDNISISAPSCQSLTKFALSHDSNYTEVKQIIRSKLQCTTLKSCKHEQIEGFLKTWCKLISKNYRPILNQCSSIISPLYSDIYDQKSQLSNQLLLLKQIQQQQDPSQQNQLNISGINSSTYGSAINITTNSTPLNSIPGSISNFSDAFNNYLQLSQLCKLLSPLIIQCCLSFFKKPSLLDHQQYKKSLKEKIHQQKIKGFLINSFFQQQQQDQLEQCLKELSSDPFKREIFLTIIGNPENLDNQSFIQKIKQHITPTSQPLNLPQKTSTSASTSTSTITTPTTTTTTIGGASSPSKDNLSPKPSPTFSKPVDPRLEKRNNLFGKALPLISQQQVQHSQSPQSPTIQNSTLNSENSATSSSPTTNNTSISTVPTPIQPVTFKKNSIFSKSLPLIGQPSSSSISATLAAASASIKPTVNNNSISATLAAATATLQTKTTTSTTNTSTNPTNSITAVPSSPSLTIKPSIDNTIPSTTISPVTTTTPATTTSTSAPNTNITSTTPNTTTESTINTPTPITTTLLDQPDMEIAEKKKNLFSSLPLIGQKPSPPLVASSTTNTTLPTLPSSTITTTTIDSPKKVEQVLSPLSSSSPNITPTPTTNTISSSSSPSVASATDEKKKNLFAPLTLIGQTSSNTTNNSTNATVISPSSQSPISSPIVSNTTTLTHIDNTNITKIIEKKKNPFAPLPLIGQTSTQTQIQTPASPSKSQQQQVPNNKPTPPNQNIFSKPLPLIGNKPTATPSIPSNAPKKPLIDIYQLPPTTINTKKVQTKSLNSQSLGVKLMNQQPIIPSAKKLSPQPNIFSKPLPLIGQQQPPTPQQQQQQQQQQPTKVASPRNATSTPNTIESLNNTRTTTTSASNTNVEISSTTNIVSQSPSPVPPTLVKPNEIENTTKEIPNTNKETILGIDITDNREETMKKIENDEDNENDEDEDNEEDDEEDDDEEDEDDDEEEEADGDEKDEEELMIDDTNTSFDQSSSTTSSKKRSNTLLLSDSEDEDDVENKKLKLESEDSSTQNDDNNNYTTDNNNDNSNGSSSSTKVNKKNKKKKKKTKKAKIEENKIKIQGKVKEKKSPNKNNNKNNNNKKGKKSKNTTPPTTSASIETAKLYQGIDFNQPKEKKELTVVCNFYKIGMCKKGKECTFIHEGPVEIRKPTEVCKYFKTSSCAKGDSCTYSHDLKIEPCKYYNSPTGCTNVNCQYDHRLITTPTLLSTSNNNSPILNSSPLLSNTTLPTATTTSTTTPNTTALLTPSLLTSNFDFNFQDNQDNQDNFNKPFLSFQMDNQYLFQQSPPQKELQYNQQQQDDQQNSNETF
ncbi:hypothetical protein RB653_003154 [Dictyostelium firmibasis]|uniref:C3H1-type domain-containing protein n=1 Tax=Dictyostelium firmibasis TaxID=79012 RepID=A0AAN7TYR9_9MYCE